MYLPILPQPDCVSAWFEAVKQVDALPGHEAYNVVIDIASPTAGTSMTHPVVSQVNEFLLTQCKSVEAIANTIFPQALYEQYGTDFIKIFHERVLPRLKTKEKWSGSYFERMTNLPVADGGQPIDQLSNMIKRMKNKKNNSLNKHEMSIFDPARDTSDSVYGGQCLSFLSFHLKSGGAKKPKTLLLTAQYRNHYYIEKLLGNLIGLGRLMAFVAAQTDAEIGALTVISTHAEIDLFGTSRQEITTLIAKCSSMMNTPSKSAA